MSFVAPGRQNPGPNTQCYACGALKQEHGPAGACPPDTERCEVPVPPARGREWLPCWRPAVAHGYCENHQHLYTPDPFARFDPPTKGAPS